MTLRDEQGRLLAGSGVVWIASDKAEAARVALGVAEQAGLVRSVKRAEA